jgi:hypothetical protein
MTGLVPVIHDFNRLKPRQSWMAGTRPAMTGWQRLGLAENSIFCLSTMSEFSHSLRRAP